MSPLEGVDLGRNTTIECIYIALTDGRTAHDLATAMGLPVILYDLTMTGKASRAAFTTSRNVPSRLVERFVATLKAQGVAATRLPDWPALAVMRTVAMLANEAFEAVLQGVGNEADVDAAMRFGVNYPKGPIEWARQIGVSHILAAVDNLYKYTGDPRYRASLGLRLAAQQG
jgi:3-hydroxybutyryl-CoA dehydrogenase